MLDDHTKSSVDDFLDKHTQKKSQKKASAPVKKSSLDYIFDHLIIFSVICLVLITISALFIYSLGRPIKIPFTTYLVYVILAIVSYFAYALAFYMIISMSTEEINFQGALFISFVGSLVGLMSQFMAFGVLLSIVWLIFLYTMITFYFPDSSFWKKIGIILLIGIISYLITASIGTLLGVLGAGIAIHA